jgi:2-methylfumaryl-CoA hydratase
MKATNGHFFEDFSLGMRLVHPVPRTVHGGDLAMYIALTGDRRPLSSSTEVARSLGFQRECAHDLLAFHLVFGKTVGDISQNAIANLGYANVRFTRPLYPGDTISAESEIIGLRELSNGKAGIVYVTSRGVNQKGQEILSFHRWVMVNKRDPGKKSGIDSVPSLPASVAPADLPVPECLNLSRFEQVARATGGKYLWDDYEIGERIEHTDAMTIEEADHMTATRQYQNGARVHFDAAYMATQKHGKRLVYGGHVISVAYAIAYNGLENVLRMAAWNGGQHVNPTFAGDTIYAWTDVLDRAELPNRRDCGALRLRLVAVKNVDPRGAKIAIDGDKPDDRVVLNLDYWGIVPRRP